MSFTNGSFTTEMPLPLAFGLALDEYRINEQHGEKLTEYEKEKLITDGENAKSKAEMEDLRQKIEEGDSIE